jgi:hypothetical protein
MNLLFNIISALCLAVSAAVPIVHQIAPTWQFPGVYIALASALGTPLAKYARPLKVVDAKWSPLLNLVWVLGMCSTAIAAGLAAHPIVVAAIAVVGIACAHLAPAPTGVEPSVKFPPPGPPGPVLLPLALGASLFLGSCAHVPPVVKAVGNCAVQAVHDASLNIFGAVQSALASGDWETQLVALVVQVGEDAVSCAVSYARDNATKNATRSDDALAPVMAAHADAWLAAHPLKP